MMTEFSPFYHALLPYAGQRFVRRSHTLFERGDDGREVYLVLNGQVEIFVDHWRRRTLISRKRSGQIFGELALLGGGTRTASAITVEDSCLGVVPRCNFDRCLDENPGLKENLLRDQIDLIGQLTMRVSTASLDAYSRLRFSLLDMARPAQDGLAIPNRLTQRDLAAHAGCTRETAAKIMVALKRGGWLRFESNRVLILKTLPERF
jgi:CRP/FNR family transcriptional regulator, cyclic AMP receptor protein